MANSFPVRKTSMAGLLSLSSTWQTTARANSSSDSANTRKTALKSPDAAFFIGSTTHEQAATIIRYHGFMEQTVEIAGQTVSIHYSGNTLVSYDPIVYLHSLKGNGSEVWGQCQSLNCPPFTLISIPTPNWNNPLTPWKCSRVCSQKISLSRETPDSTFFSLKQWSPKPSSISKQRHIIAALRAILWQGYSLLGHRSTPLSSMLLQAHRARCGIPTSANTYQSIPLRRNLCALIFPSVQKKQKHPAAFFAAFRKEQKALFRRFRKKALKPSLSQIPETTSKNPTCAWPRVSVGCFANSIDRTGLLNTFMVFAL